MKLTTEKRRAQRFPLVWPVRFEGGQGLTRNVSSNGVWFDTLQCLSTGCPIRLELRPCGLVQGPERLECEGVVVRVVLTEQGYGVAVQWTALRFAFTPLENNHATVIFLFRF